MTRQTLGSLWVWAVSKLPSTRKPVVELSVATNLDATMHNGRVLVCTQPILISAIVPNMGDGFHCDLINVSGGDVRFAAGIMTSSGARSLATGQSAAIHCVTYSGGTIVHAATAGSTPSVQLPGAPTGVVASSVTSTSVTLLWSTPASGGAAIAYNVEYRLSASSSWGFAIQGTTGMTYTVAGLTPSNYYDFRVTATNTGGSGTPSDAVTLVTPMNALLPGSPVNVAVTPLSSNSVLTTWNAPSSGGAPISYTVQYKTSGTATWTSIISGITQFSLSITGLTSSTVYDVRVFATNSAGSGQVSATATVKTATQTGAVGSILWNFTPTGPYSHGSGAIGVNAHVSPSSAAIEFGFSTSAVSPPSAWTPGLLVNSDLWGAYVPTPATAGQWYAWARGTDGSAPTVYSITFPVI